MKNRLKKSIKATKKILNYVADSYEKFERNQRYHTFAFCTNCPWNGKIYILKGVPVIDTIHKVKCPNCQCKTLVVDFFRREEK
jgi:hypothetical protein